MIESIWNLFDSAGLMPHGVCFLWREELVYMHLFSDLVTALAYFSLPVFLVVLVRRRPELGMNKVIALFALFIFFCGLTHLANIWVLWVPDYLAQGVLKLATGIVSVFTAFVVWPLLPKLLAMPSTAQLMATNARLALEVEERRAAEDAREVAEMALRRSQRMEAVGQLTGGIAHDFNNLLGIQMGNLEFLKDKVKGDAAATKWATNALRATERGAQLTRRLLGFSRQEARPGTPTDVNEVLADLEDILAKSLTSEIAVEIYPGDGLWPAEIDPGDLSDAVLNLALNARDAMPKGGRLVIETVNRAVGTEQLEREPEMTAGDYVLVSVSDTGTGMTAEVLERVFDPFFTTKAESGGTGLGMSMVYGFAKRSRGHVRIYSEAGHGTTVRLFLPRAQTEAETAAVATQKTLPRGTETVLVVDDEPDLLDIAGTMLRELGYRTAAARNGREASAILEGSAGKDIDLVFSDVIMPGGMNGFDLAARARETRPGVRVLLASGFTGHVTDKSADRTLVDAMLHKPYDKTQLAYAVREILDAGGAASSL